MLTVWNAFNDIFNDDFWGRPLSTQSSALPSALSSALPSALRSFVPRVDISEDEKHYLVTADVPGMKPEELDIQVENNVLTIRGERKYESRGEKHGYHRIERHYGSFQRSFALPEGVNAEAIEATVENGTLTLSVPKPAAALPQSSASRSNAPSPAPESPATPPAAAPAGNPAPPSRNSNTLRS